MKKIPRLLEPKSSYTFDYPQAETFTSQQLKTLWFPEEIQVEKDVHCILTELTEAERHGVITTLKLFTLYELIVGGEYWGGVVAKYFPRPEIQKMANMMAFIELNVHAPFYDKINKALGLATDEFYTSYVNDKTLNERISYLEGIVSQTKDNLLLSLAVFSMVEGAVLYSSFAFLKHFQSNGKDKMTNIVAGINFSALDEDLHSQAGAWLFRTLLSESNLSPEELLDLQNATFKAAIELRSHEYRIIDMIFEKGEIEGISKHQLYSFVDHRLQVCITNLGFEVGLTGSDDSSIQDWFYAGAKGYVFHDFFSKVGREYQRDWSKGKFIWGQVE